MAETCLSLEEVLAVQIGVTTMILLVAWLIHSAVVIVGEAILAEKREREQQHPAQSTDPLIDAGLEKRTSYYAKKEQRL